jgi:hypothetical protein
MPILVTSYFAQSSVNGDTTTLNTPSFTPANGEVIVVKTITWDSGTPSGTPSGGSLTYTRRSTAAPGGFNGYATIFTSVVSGSPGSMSVTLSAPAGSCYHSMVVERWSGAKLATTPATSSPINGGGAPTATITTTAAGSIVTWASMDENSRDPTGHTYLSGAIEDGIADGHASTSSVHYYAYQTASATGVQTIGMSLPSTQQWVMTGIEIQASTLSSPGAFMTFFQ